MRLDYCDIRYAANGVKIFDGAENSSWIRNCTIRDCSGRGVFMKDTKGVEIAETLIDSCAQGIWARDCSLTITNNVIERNDLGIFLKKTAARVDTNIVRLNGTASDGIQMHVVGPGGNVIEVYCNFFGGASSPVCEHPPQGDICWVEKGVVSQLTGIGPGDTLVIDRNTFKYIDQTGLEINLRDLFLPGDTPNKVAVGPEQFASEVEGNVFDRVKLPFDLIDARNTVISGTAAVEFDLALRSNNERPVFGDTSASLGGYNIFRTDEEDSTFIGFINVTDSIPGKTFYAEDCQWNTRPCDDLEQNDPDFFLVNGVGLPNEISLDPCNMGPALGVSLDELLAEPEKAA